MEKRLNIQRYNNKCKYETGYICGNIENEEIQNKILTEIEFWKKNENIKELDVLIATPPCQGMSVANHKKNNEIIRNSLIVQSIYLIKKIKPKYFIFENVKAFLKTICNDVDGKIFLIEELIDKKLDSYNITKKVINFKDYGSNSSRTRTLVIGVRNDINILPSNLFPQEEKQKILVDIIGNLKSLKNMGEIDETDIYHSFKKYDKKMLPWIENTKEGDSAFNNEKKEYKPHKIINGKIVLNVNKNGDKYKRCRWNEVMPCIHTRNDILASQSTIHPKDNRVFSIRELMMLMTIPNDFKWVEKDFEELNKMTLTDKEKFLKKEEINIRQSIGEAVPTEIFRQIAHNILVCENKLNNNKKEKFNSLKDIEVYIDNSTENIDINDIIKDIERLNSNKIKNSAYYTSKDICKEIMEELPNFKKNIINILEPSVGAGSFIPFIIEKYKNKKINIDIIDIDNNILNLTNKLYKNINKKNIFINPINTDYLKYNTDKKYDLIIGNPPFGAIEDSSLLKEYKKQFLNKKTNNIFSFFIEKSLNISNFVGFILPKSFLNSPEYNITRNILENKTEVKTIIDFGEKAFNGVKIETIFIILKTNNNKVDYPIKIKSHITNNINTLSNKIIFDNDLSMWLIYKNNFFINLKERMKLDIFKSFRDRQITKKFI